jgi:hypothetical protein
MLLFAQQRLTLDLTRFSTPALPSAHRLSLCYDGVAQARRPSTREGGDAVDFVTVVDEVIALRRSRVRLIDRPSHPVAMGCSVPRGPSRTSAALAIASRCMHQGASSSGAAVGPSTDPHHCRSLGNSCAMQRRCVLGWSNTPPACRAPHAGGEAIHPRFGSWRPRSHICAWCSCCSWRRA